MAVRKSWAPALVGTLLFARLGGAFLIDVEILTGDPDTPLMRRKYFKGPARVLKCTAELLENTTGPSQCEGYRVWH